MEEYLEAVLAGAVQGLTEFLPVSSSGHLALLSLLGVDIGEGVFMTVMLHLGTLLSVIVVYRKKLFSILKHPLKKPAVLLYAATGVSFVIAGSAKLLLGKTIDALFTSPLSLTISFSVTSLFLFLSDIIKKRNREVSLPSALTIGAIQGVAAIFPGLSRSGSTIAAGIIVGADKEKTADFSFLLSVPVIIGAAAYEILSVIINGTAIEIQPLPTIAGVITAFLSGTASVLILLKTVKRGRLYPFGLYTLAIALFIAVFFV